MKCWVEVFARSPLGNPPRLGPCVFHRETDVGPFEVVEDRGRGEGRGVGGGSNSVRVVCHPYVSSVRPLNLSLYIFIKLEKCKMYKNIRGEVKKKASFRLVSTS